MRHDRLLFSDGSIRKTGIQESSLTIVVGLGWLAENTIYSVRGSTIKNRVFSQFRGSWIPSVKFFSGARTGE